MSHFTRLLLLVFFTGLLVVFAFVAQKETQWRLSIEFSADHEGDFTCYYHYGEGFRSEQHFGRSYPAHEDKTFSLLIFDFPKDQPPSHVRFDPIASTGDFTFNASISNPQLKFMAPKWLFFLNETHYLQLQKSPPTQWVIFSETTEDEIIFSVPPNSPDPIIYLDLPQVDQPGVTPYSIALIVLGMIVGLATWIGSTQK